MIDKSPMVLRAMLLEAESRSRVYSFARIKLATALGISAIRMIDRRGSPEILLKKSPQRCPRKR